jgi:hypothetical protein
VQGDLAPNLIVARALGQFVPVLYTSNAGEELELGWAGEVEVALQPQAFPLRLFVGYRMERIDLDGTLAEGIDRQTRFGGVTMGVQVAY